MVSRTFRITLALFTVLAFAAGCASKTTGNKNSPFFNLQQEDGLKDGVAKLRALAKKINEKSGGWTFEDVERMLLEESGDVRKKGDYPKPVFGWKYTPGQSGDQDLYWWEFAAVKQSDVTVVPGITNRISEVTLWKLSVLFLEGKVYAAHAEMNPTRDKEKVLSTKPYVAVGIAAGAALLLLNAGP